MTNEMITFREIGYSSETIDGKHILMFDVDNIYSYSRMIKHIKKLQVKYCLSDFFIFKTRGGFHLVCLDKFFISQVMEIKRFFNIDDKLHNMISFDRGKWILRLGDDIILIDIVVSNGIHEKSNAHRQLLNIYFCMNIKETDDYDIFGNIVMENYLKKKSKDEYDLLRNKNQVDNFFK